MLDNSKFERVVIFTALAAVLNLACGPGDGRPPETRCERARGKVAALVEAGLMSPSGAEPRLFFIHGGEWRAMKPFGPDQYAMARELLAYARCTDPATETVHMWDMDYRGGKLASFDRGHKLALYYLEPSMERIIKSD